MRSIKSSIIVLLQSVCRGSIANTSHVLASIAIRPSESSRCRQSLKPRQVPLALPVHTRGWPRSLTWVAKQQDPATVRWTACKLRRTHPAPNARWQNPVPSAPSRFGWATLLKLVSLPKCLTNDQNVESPTTNDTSISSPSPATTGVSFSSWITPSESSSATSAHTSTSETASAPASSSCQITFAL